MSLKKLFVFLLAFFAIGEYAISFLLRKLGLNISIMQFFLPLAFLLTLQFLRNKDIKLIAYLFFVLVFFILISLPFVNNGNINNLMASSYYVKGALSSWIAVFVSYKLISDQNDIKTFEYGLRYGLVLNIALVLLSLVGLLEINTDVDRTLGVEFNRYSLGDPNIGSIYFMYGAIIWYRLITKKLISKITGVTLTLASLLCIIAGGSRGGLVTWGIIFLLVLISFMNSSSYSRERSHSKQVIKQMLFTAVFLLFILYLLSSNDYFLNTVLRFSSSGGIKSLSTRINSWIWLINELILSFNFIGNGYNEFIIKNNTFQLPHNTYADFYIIGGGIYLILILIFLFKLFYKYFKTLSFLKNPKYDFVPLIIISILILLTSLSHPWFKYFWIMIGILMKLPKLKFETYNNKRKIRVKEKVVDL